MFRNVVVALGIVCIGCGEPTDSINSMTQAAGQCLNETPSQTLRECADRGSLSARQSCWATAWARGWCNQDAVQGFETVTTAQAQAYIVNPLNTTAQVVSSPVASGSKSLEVNVLNSSTPGYDPSGVKLCASSASATGFVGAVKLNASNFSDYMGLVVQGGSGEFLYWLWLNHTGRMFGSATIAQLSVNSWYSMQLYVNRSSGRLAATVGGTYAEENLTGYPVSTVGMQCFTVFVSGDQHFYVDDVLAKNL